MNTHNCTMLWIPVPSFCSEFSVWCFFSLLCMIAHSIMSVLEYTSVKHVACGCFIMILQGIFTPNRFLIVGSLGWLHALPQWHWTKAFLPGRHPDRQLGKLFPKFTRTSSKTSSLLQPALQDMGGLAGWSPVMMRQARTSGHALSCTTCASAKV